MEVINQLHYINLPCAGYFIMMAKQKPVSSGVGLTALRKNTYLRNEILEKDDWLVGCTGV